MLPGMPEVTVAASALVDIASKDDLAAHHERLAKLFAKERQHFTRAFGFVATGSGPLVIDLGSPPMGMIWLPQWVTLMGDAPFLGAANVNIANVSAAVFAGAVPRQSGLVLGPPVSGTGLDHPNCIGAGLLLPSTFSVPDKSPVFAQEHLYVVLAGSGLAAGAAGVYRAVAGVIEIPATDEALAAS